MSAFFGIWHGPEGLKKQATRMRFMIEILIEEMTALEISIITHKTNHFDTICLSCKDSGFSSSDFVLSEFHKFGINLRKIDEDLVGISLNETTTIVDLDEIIEIFADITGKRST
jgi:glycine dehydrogenase